MKVSIQCFGGALALLGLVLLTPAAVGSGESDEPIMVFFVRHAEAAQSTSGAQGGKEPGPGLSESGRERARALGRLLSRAGVTHLFASQYRRAQQTLQPLEERTDHEVLVIRAQQPEDQLRKLRELPGGSIAVVAGHSNTIPGLVCDLGGATTDLDCSESGRSLGHHEYDRLYLVTLPAAAATASFAPRTLALRYGD